MSKNPEFVVYKMDSYGRPQHRILHGKASKYGGPFLAHLFTASMLPAKTETKGE